MGKKYDIREIMLGRVEEIDKQLITAIKRQQWGLVDKLRTEKKRLEAGVK